MRIFAPVIRPAVPLVYLDLNHYIGLAKAARGTNPGSGYTELLEAAARAASQNRAIFPLSTQHLLETTLAIKDPKQRINVAAVMEHLSGFSYLLGRVDIFELELKAGIARLMNEPRPDAWPLLGPTFLRAFGKVGGLKIVDKDGVSGDDEVRAQMGSEEFEAMMQEMNLMAERTMLRGPSDEEAALLRAKYGWKPEEAVVSQQERLGLELAKRDQLNAKPDGVDYRRNRLRDYVSAHEVVHDWLDLYTRVKLERVEAGHPAYEPSDADGRALFERMPHLQVAICMKTHYHRNPQHNWTTNDIYDIDALSIAYAYCDVVYTDKAAANALLRATELRDLNTYVPRDPYELAAWLNAAPQRPTGDLYIPAGTNINW